GGVGENLVAGVHDRFSHFGCYEVHHLAENTKAGSDAFRAPYNGFADHVRGLVGADGWHVVIELGGGNHWGPYQWHVDRGKANALVWQFAGGTTSERIQCCFGGDVSREAWCVG